MWWSSGLLSELTGLLFGGVERMSSVVTDTTVQAHSLKTTFASRFTLVAPVGIGMYV
jgi:hypothetical protein